MRDSGLSDSRGAGRSFATVLVSVDVDGDDSEASCSTVTVDVVLEVLSAVTVDDELSCVGGADSTSDVTGWKLDTGFIN